MKTLHQNVYTLFILLCVLAVSSVFIPVTESEAGLSKSFGGKVTASVICGCAPTTSLITVTGSNKSMSGTYLYVLGSTKGSGKIFARPGSNILGRYVPGGVCVQGIIPACSPLNATKGTLTAVGISK